MAIAHGGRVEAAASTWGCELSDVLDLSTGVYPEPASAELARSLTELAPVINRYPDPDGEPARSALAEVLGVATDSLLLGAGAQAFVEIVFDSHAWRSLAVEEPCYGEVRRCAERSGVEVRSTRPGVPQPRADAAWVTSPHSFTGLTCALPEVPVGVLDESYADLETRSRTRLSPQWVRIGSLTKCFSMPGLRLGYAIASPEVTERLRALLPPWPTSTLALYLLPRLLPSWVVRDRAAAAGRERLRALLLRAGWSCLESQASFVLAKKPHVVPDFAKHRVLVREFPEWPSLGEWVRFGVPADARGWHRLEEVLCR